MKKLIQESYEQFLADRNLNEAVTIKVSLRHAREAGDLFQDMGGSKLGKADATDVWQFKKYDDAATFVNTLIITMKIPNDEIYSSNKSLQRQFGIED